MSGQVLLLIILFITAIALLVFHHLSVKGHKEGTALYYNLGLPCPDGMAASPCPYCGEVFGYEVAEAARQRCERGLRGSAPADSYAGGVLDLFQNIRWDVDCPSCGGQSSYVPQARILLHRGV